MSEKALTEIDLHNLIICTIACGKWESVGLSEDQALGIIEKVCEDSNNHFNNEIYLKTIFYSAQDALMNLRQDDFHTIQKEPPFSEFGYKKLLSFVIDWTKGGDKLLLQTFKNAYKNDIAPNQIIKIKGGDGLSENEAITIETSNNELRVRCQNWYVSYLFGRGCKYFHTSVFSKNHPNPLSMLNITTSEGLSKILYFRGSQK